jgi:hypothetical protein
MNKHARLLALLLALTLPLGFTTSANAAMNNCERALRALETTDAYTNPVYYYWMLYYFNYCGG